MKTILSVFTQRKVYLLLLLAGIGFAACQKEKFAYQTDSTLNISSYLANDPEQFSEFSEILKLSGTAAYLDAYGTYTVFAPTNNAIKQFLQEMGKSSVNELDANTLKDMVRLHLIEDTVATTAFTDGKIPTATMYGQYLTTGAANEGGTTRITVNKTSRILQGNIRVGNGIIHTIDHVLIEAKRTLAQQIAANPSLSIFNEALAATGWDQKLNAPVTYDADSVPSYVAVLAETNEVFAESGIHSFADLKAKYSHTGNPTSPEDSLYLFVAYRILPGLKYMADIVSSPSHLTKAPLEVITVKLSKDTVLLNEAVFNNVLEKGIPVDRTISDISCTNGVLHFVKGNVSIKKRLPMPVYFDVADQPEFRALASIFRKPGKSQAFAPGSLKDIKWGGSLNVAYVSHTPGSNMDGAYWNDFFELTRLRTGADSWVEFKTPVIIKGRYKVWITYRTAGKASLVQAKFNGEPLSRLVDFREYRNKEFDTPEKEREYEAQGYKRSLINTTGNYNSRLLGIIDVPTTDRHIIRLEALTGASQQTWIDVIEFRPVDMDQLYPRFGTNGELKYEF